MKKLIGVFGLFVVFLVLFALISETMGFWTTALVWAQAVVTTAVILLFVWLIVE